ncbi:class I SAM-dependent methyltransferase [Hydrogenophaga sp. PBL-H3]|nr:class I SAM-dependent methyltransferase [Hydrogenophaga sp. PBL-H3]QHE79544.1 class I SAM-dependent methyltransferase [Hydrogenophaga sp. PBL-H3]
MGQRTRSPTHSTAHTVYLQRPFDHVVTFRNSQGESARGTLTNLQRRSLVMEVYNPYSIVQVSEVLSDLTIRSGDRSIYKGKAVVVSLLNTGLMAVVSLALIDEWSDLTLTRGESAGVGQQAQQFVQGWFERFKIKRGYLVAVSEIRAYLAEVSRWTDHADFSSALPRGEDGRVISSVFEEISSPLMLVASNYFAALEAETQDVPEGDLPTYRNFAQASLHPLLLRAPFVYRTFAKPLGYAGDYEMVNQILSDPQQGGTTYFQMINALFLQSAVAQAHRNRIEILVKHLKDVTEQARTLGRPLRVLNIGCGPAVEIERFLLSGGDPDSAHFTLVDFSEVTLEHTRAKLEEVGRRLGKPVRFELVNDSVHNLLKRATRSDASPASEAYDFAYCAGLFDYLSDKVCSRLLEYLYARTRPGGQVLVTNVHSSNSQRGVMEHVLEWYLIYRDEARLQSVLPTGRSDEKIFTDTTGVNVFASFFVPALERADVR